MEWNVYFPILSPNEMCSGSLQGLTDLSLSSIPTAIFVALSL